MQDEPSDQADDATDAATGAAPARPADVTPHEAAEAVEAILFASDNPLNVSRIAQVAEVPPRMIRPAVTALNERYDQMGCAFAIEEVAGGFQMLTRPEYHDLLSRLFESKKETRLSQAAMETLAIVAYRQPILRADVEAIRGVSCGEVLRGLMERHLVKIAGRAEVIGRPMLYGTTRRFLELFGLRSLDDLPKVDELRSGRPEASPPTPDDEENDQPSAETDEDEAEAAAVTSRASEAQSPSEAGADDEETDEDDLVEGDEEEYDEDDEFDDEDEEFDDEEDEEED